MKAFIFLSIATALSAYGQIQSGGLDLVGTFKVYGGTSLPGTCTVREIFFKTDATAGANLYTCTATNTWTPPVAAVSTGAGAPTSSCSAGALYVDTTYYNLYVCPATDTWEKQSKVLLSSGDPNSTIPFGCDSVEEAGRLIVDTTGTTAVTSLYACAADGVDFSWQAIVGGGGASAQTDLSDLKVTAASSTITIPVGLGPRSGNTVCPVGSIATQVITSGTGTVYVSVAPDCSYLATSTVTFGTSTNIVTESGSQFHAGYSPLATCAVSSGAVSSCTDKRRAFGGDPIAAGTNVAVSYSASGVATISAGSGVTASGSSCTITAITSGVITAATCAP